MASEQRTANANEVEMGLKSPVFLYFEKSFKKPFIYFAFRNQMIKEAKKIRQRRRKTKKGNLPNRMANPRLRNQNQVMPLRTLSMAKW